MLERFRQRYPLGSLSSELLTIDRGKYLVRTSIQVNGTLLGTGMGEGDTIEQAEDRARLRAMAILALDNEVEVASQPATEVKPPKPRVSELSATEPVKNQEVNIEPAPAEIPPKPAPASKKREKLPTPAESPPPVEEPLPLIPVKTETEPLLDEPIDFSEVIAKSDMELKRLGWTNEQGRNYLLATYGKRSRQLLSDEELIEFMQYLQSLPNP